MHEMQTHIGDGRQGQAARHGHQPNSQPARHGQLRARTPRPTRGFAAPRHHPGVRAGSSRFGRAPTQLLMLRCSFAGEVYSYLACSYSSMA